MSFLFHATSPQLTPSTFPDLPAGAGAGAAAAAAAAASAASAASSAASVSKLKGNSAKGVTHRING